MKPTEAQLDLIWRVMDEPTRAYGSPYEHARALFAVIAPMVVEEAAACAESVEPTLEPGADARLIAAAPELLAALKEQINRCHCAEDGDDDRFRHPECRASRALIARIESDE